MEPRQRRILAGLGVGVVVVAVLVAVLVRRGEGEGEAVTTTTTDAAPTTTTLRLETSTTTTAPAATTTTAPSAGEVVDGEGAVLSPAQGPARPAAACAVLAEPGYDAECGRAGDLVWLVETSRATGGLRVTVFEPAGAGTVRPALAAVDDGPDGAVRFSRVTARAVDLSGDGADELVIGFRGQGSGGSLDVDVVGAGADVVVHRTLDQGQATAAPGRLDLWEPVYGEGDARCCPSAWHHEIVTFADGAWRVASATDERRSSPPAGDL